MAAPDLDARWAAWVARGREHERRVRRRIALCVGTVGALALGAFTIYALLKP